MARLNYVTKFRGTSKTEDGSLECESCDAKIVKGDPYVWWANKVGRSSIKHVRCSKPECRPKPWQYATTSPHIRGLMQAEESGQLAVGQIKFSGKRDDVDAFREELASTVHDVAPDVSEVGEGYAESAQNMEDGFEHATYQSEELTGKADDLQGQAEELESFEVGEAPDDDDDLESWAEDQRNEAEEAISAGDGGTMIEDRPIPQITSLAALYDFVNHYWTNGRLDDQEGRFHMYGREGVRLTLDPRNHVVITDENFDRVEVLQDGDYVPLLEFNAERHAAIIDRLEARQGFERSVEASRTTARHLRESLAQLHPDDRDLMLAKAGLLDVGALGNGEIEWPSP